MLVYHDSMIHSWWEIHNYNNPWRGRTSMLGGMFEYGGGRPRLMASLDALMGCPPDVFPFGAQYGYSGHGKETFLYRYRFEDPTVQLALQAALPGFWRSPTEACFAEISRVASLTQPAKWHVRPRRPHHRGCERS